MRRRTATLVQSLREDWSARAVLIVFGVGLVVYAFVYAVARSHMPVDADGQGYYAYLPAYIVEHDPSFNTAIHQGILPAYANLKGASPQLFGFSLQPSGSWLDKYGVGVAILLLPVFLAGHLLALAVGAHADGYSRIETLVSGAGAILYMALGLLALRAVLLRWFSRGITAATLLLLTLGTGAVNYFSWAPLFSHDFTFFAVAVMVLAALRWIERPASLSRATMLGLAMGAVMAIRLTNAVLLLAVPLMLVGSFAQARDRGRIVIRHAGAAAVAVLCAGACLLPQLATWYIATGHLITRPYPGESFDFLHPHLLESLVWLQPHGILPYYPVLGLSLIGLALAWFRRRDLAVPLTLALVVFWYVSSSWWDWSFSEGFGDRAYIDVVPLLAPFLALLFASIARPRVRAAMSIAAAGMAAITCVVLLAYWQRRLPQDGIDAAGYAHILTHPAQLLSLPGR